MYAATLSPDNTATTRQQGEIDRQMELLADRIAELQAAHQRLLSSISIVLTPSLPVDGKASDNTPVPVQSPLAISLHNAVRVVEELVTDTLRTIERVQL